MEPELKTELLETLKSLRETPSTRNRATKVLNAPFTVTLLGGVILAIVSGLIAQYTTESDKAREIALEGLRQRQAFVDTFTSKMEMYFELTLSVRKREIYLNDWQGNPDRDKNPYPDGRNFEETRNKWEEEKRYWLDHSTGSPTGLISTAKILFNSPKMRAALDTLAAYSEQYGEATNEDDLNKAHDAAFKEIENTAVKMADEIHP